MAWLNGFQSGGGDPEGKGFFRSVTGARTAQTTAPIVVDCGFIPEALTGIITGFTNATISNGSFAWATELGEGASTTLHITTVTLSVGVMAVSVQGTVITFAPVRPNSRSINCVFKITGRALE